MYLIILKLLRIKTFSYDCYCRHINTKYHVGSQAVCYQFFHGTRQYERYKMNCHPMCKMHSIKSIQVRLHPSMFKAMRFRQYTKKLQWVQKVPVTRTSQNVYRWTIPSIRMGNDEPWNRRLQIGYFAHSQKFKKRQVHPNTHLYRFFLYLENQLKKYRDSTHILEEIL